MRACMCACACVCTCVCAWILLHTLGGYAFVDDAASTPRAWDVVCKIKIEYVNCVNGVAFQNEQIGHNTHTHTHTHVDVHIYLHIY